MSTGKTEHLQLNQWAATDDFLREEFNEDNRKVDAAVQAAVAREAVVLLGAYHIPSGGISELEIDMAALQPHLYSTIQLRGRGILCKSTTGGRIYLNGDRTLGHYQYKDSAGNQGPYNGLRLPNLPLSSSNVAIINVDFFLGATSISAHSRGLYSSGVTLQEGEQFSCTSPEANCNETNWRSLTFSTDENITWLCSGDIYLYGVKK